MKFSPCRLLHASPPRNSILIHFFVCLFFFGSPYNILFLVNFNDKAFYPLAIAVRGYSNSGCPSVTLSCLRDNLSKHG